MKSIFVIFLVFSINLFPQKLTDVFRSELPEVVFEKKSNIDQVNTSLELYGKMNPELVYYYIKYIQAQFDTISIDTFYIKSFFKIKQNYEYLYNDWVSELLKSVEIKDLDNRLKDLSIEFIEDYYDDEIQSFELPELLSNTNSNYLNYIVAKFLDRNLQLNYVQSHDYLIDRVRAMDSKKEKFNDLILNPASYTPYDYDVVMNNLYLFKENNNKSSFNLIVESIITSIDRYYNNRNLYNSTEWYISGSYKNSFMYMDKDTYTNKYDPSGIKYLYDNPTVSLGYSHKFYLTEYQNIFNYIRIKGEVGFGFGNKTTEQSGLISRKSNVDGISNRFEVFGFNSRTFEIKNSQFLSVGLSVPFFHLFDHLSFNIGGGLIMLNTNYSVSYDYYYRKFDQEFLGPVILDSEYDSARNKPFSSLSFIVSPEFSICLDFKNNLTYFISVSNNYISFGAGLNL
jgi:hypothetical protein